MIKFTDKFTCIERNPCHQRSVLMYHNTLVWLETRDALSWDRKIADFTSVGYLTAELSSFSLFVKEFFRHIFFTQMPPQSKIYEKSLAFMRISS